MRRHSNDLKTQTSRCLVLSESLLVCVLCSAGEPLRDRRRFSLHDGREVHYVKPGLAKERLHCICISTDSASIEALGICRLSPTTACCLGLYVF